MPKSSAPRSARRQAAQGDTACARRRRGAAARSGSAAGCGVVAVKDGKNTPTPVETGITDLDRVEITGGLAEGEQALLLPTAEPDRGPAADPG